MQASSQIQSGRSMRHDSTSAMSNISINGVDLAPWSLSVDGVEPAPENENVVYEDGAIRVTSVNIAPGSIEKPRRHRLPSVFITGFYELLSASSIEGMSAARAHDSNVATLHETSSHVSVGWPAALESWRAAPFKSFAELSCVMTKFTIKVRASIGRIASLERVGGKMRKGERFAFSALGTNIYEKHPDKWLIVHHHTSKIAPHLTT
jgi:ketosteroid isomerase-like protein